MFSLVVPLAAKIDALIRAPCLSKIDHYEIAPAMFRVGMAAFALF